LARVTAEEQVGVVGAGVIGASWAALFLAHGYRVDVYDPSPNAEARCRQIVGSVWPDLESQGVSGTAWEGRLTFRRTLGDAVRDALFVQECGPEELKSKQELMATIDAYAPLDTVIASSSSGIAPSHLQADCAHPERILIGHPFNPAHLMPLVEIVPGRRTNDLAVEAAFQMYKHLGKRPIRVRQELPGHVVNRLQAALWQEAYSMVERGVVSVAEVDEAIAYGPGLRWALLGPIANQHLSGGPAGLRHTLEHLGPPAEEWMADLRKAPLTPALIDCLVSGVNDEFAGIDLDEVIRARDQLLLQLLRAKSAQRDLP
jgi:carnitine 3-dehydrogenase